MKLSSVCRIDMELEFKSEINFIGNSSGPLFSIGFDYRKVGEMGRGCLQILSTCCRNVMLIGLFLFRFLRDFWSFPPCGRSRRSQARCAALPRGAGASQRWLAGTAEQLFPTARGTLQSKESLRICTQAVRCSIDYHFCNLITISFCNPSNEQPVGKLHIKRLTAVNCST